uniref:Uncharacterized protein n=1 Tax=Anguilla anguilla TaxID=7936 RepID=A0A0E9QR52_ANGAN
MNEDLHIVYQIIEEPNQCADINMSNVLFFSWMGYSQSY